MASFGDGLDSSATTFYIEPQAAKDTGSNMGPWSALAKARKYKQKSVVRRMVHCISKRLAQANQTILEEAREDMDRLMDLHERLASGQSLDETQKSWLRQRFERYKEMEL